MTGPATATEALARACEELRADPALRADPTLSDVVAQCRQPLRVLLVGDVSTGKSTLLNALTGRKLAETAFRETTSSVTWYHAPGQAPPRLPDPTHRAVAVEFPLAGRIMLGDSPGLNTLSDRPRHTLRMLQGAELTGAAAAFVYVLAGGRADHRADALDALAAFSAGPLDLVGNIVAVLAKADLVDASPAEMEARVREETRTPLRIATVNQILAMSARTGAVDERILTTLDRLRDLPAATGTRTTGWERLAVAVGDTLPPGHLKALEQAVGGPAWLPRLLAETAGLTTPREVAEVFERLSRIRALEAILADLADDGELFTATAATLRLRRLAARLPAAPAAAVRARLAAVQNTGPYLRLHRRAAARLLRHTGTGRDLTPAERAATLALLTDGDPGEPGPGELIRRWNALAADPFADSRTREVAALVVDTARRTPSAAPEETGR